MAEGQVLKTLLLGTTVLQMEIEDTPQGKSVPHSTFLLYKPLLPQSRALTQSNNDGQTYSLQRA